MITGAARTKQGWLKRGHFWYRRLIRSILVLDDTPHRIALGVAIGTWIAFQPIFGIQMATGGLITLILRGNVIASLPPAWITNPITAVPIYYVMYRFGAVFTGGSRSWDAFAQMIDDIQATNQESGIVQATWHAAVELADGYLLPMAIGGAIVGAVVGGILYVLTKRAVVAYQHLKVQRRMRWLAREPDPNPNR